MTEDRLSRVLSRLRPGTASGRLLSFALGHSVLDVELRSPDAVIRLRAEGTRRVEANHRWSVRDMRLRTDADGQVVVEDLEAGFKLVASAVYVLDADETPAPSGAAVGP